MLLPDNIDVLGLIGGSLGDLGEDWDCLTCPAGWQGGGGSAGNLCFKDGVVRDTCGAMYLQCAPGKWPDPADGGRCLYLSELGLETIDWYLARQGQVQVNPDGSECVVTFTRCIPVEPCPAGTAHRDEPGYNPYACSPIDDCPAYHYRDPATGQCVYARVTIDGQTYAKDPVSGFWTVQRGDPLPAVMSQDIGAVDG